MPSLFAEVPGLWCAPKSQLRLDHTLRRGHRCQRVKWISVRMAPQHRPAWRTGDPMAGSPLWRTGLASGRRGPVADRRATATLGLRVQQLGVDARGLGKIRLKCEWHVLQSLSTGPLRCAVWHGSASSEAAGQLTFVLPVHRPSFGWQIWTGFKKSIKNKNLFQVIRCFPDG